MTKVSVSFSQEEIEKLFGIKLDDYKKLTKKSNKREGKFDNSSKNNFGREWMEIELNEKFVGKENKELDLFLFYGDSPFRYLWDAPAGTDFWLKKNDLLTIIYNNMPSSFLSLSDEIQRAFLRNQQTLNTQKTQLEQAKKDKERLNIFYQEALKSILAYQIRLNVSEAELNSEYGDYQKILQETSWEVYIKDKVVENTVKSVINVLVTKRAQKELERLKERKQAVTLGEINNLLNQLEIIKQGWKEIESSKVLKENNPFYLPIIQESETLQQTIPLAIDYCKEQQQKIEDARKETTDSLHKSLSENPAFRRFVGSINKLDSVESIENFRKRMVEVINEKEQQLQPQLRAQIVQVEGGKK